MFCNQCGIAAQPRDVFCGACGFKHENPAGTTASKPVQTEVVASKTLDISWVFKSTGIFILTFIAVYFVVGFMLGLMINIDDINLNNAMVLVMVGICNLFVFFIGGFISAYFSPGITLKEPAIAIAILATLSNFFTLGIGASFLAWIVPYFIAYFGAKYGEKLQRAKAA